MTSLSKLLGTAILTALIVGVGVYQWKTCPVLTTEPAPVVTEAEPKVYQDDYLSFEYPENVELLFSTPSGGSSQSQSIEFLMSSPAQKAYTSTYLSLSYLVDAEQAVDSSELEKTEYGIDGRTATQIITGDMSGETFTITIPTIDNTGVYQIRGILLNEDVQEILDLFIETAQLNR